LVISQTGSAGRKYLVSEQNGFILNSKMPASDGRDWKCKTVIKVDGTSLAV
tara:strand:+ start:165 stop:317 length:153 start_codon:yes stop_codon:yes gene_type:complete